MTLPKYRYVIVLKDKLIYISKKCWFRSENSDNTATIIRAISTSDNL